MNHKIQTTLVIASILGLSSFGGCKKNDQAGNAMGAMAVNVVVQEVKQQPLNEALSLVGTLLANESVELKSEADGVIRQILYEEGQAVKKDDLLVQLDDTKFSAAFAEAEANFRLSKGNFERHKPLFDRNLISPQEFEQVQATFHVHEATMLLRKRELEDTKITAPFDGIIGVRNVSPGQVISKNTVVSTVVNLDPLKVEFSVPERHVSQLQIGQKVNLSVSSMPKESFEGEVYFVSSQIDPSLRTAMVRARVNNPSGKLKSGMFANLDLILNVKQDALIVPETALIPQGNVNVVYIVGQDSTAQMSPVEIGIRNKGSVEVLKGVKAGDKVIVEGYQKIRPGSPVMINNPKENASQNTAAKNS